MACLEGIHGLSLVVKPCKGMSAPVMGTVIFNRLSPGHHGDVLCLVGDGGR